MSLVVKYEKKEYTPAPEGLHQAVCVDVVDLGMQDTQWGPKQKCRIYWQIEEIDTETGKRFPVAKQYTVSLHEKATLRKDLQTWRGRKFTEQELEGFDLENLIGVNCQVQVVHNLADDGRVFANVQAVVPIGKNMTKIRASEDFVRKKDRPAQEEPKKAPQKPSDPAGEAGHPDPAYDDSVPF
jgi:hypothetical protein